ncbi:hypothetical protein LR002_01925 [Candidatus Gracilibacteria bacterium]|nr:hypothetical protein [Candidatus Gracilibacteria bacterium]
MNKNTIKQLKKIVSVMLILSFINGLFVFADNDFTVETNIVNIKNDETGKEIVDFSVGDTISTKDNSISFNFNEKLLIKIQKNSEMKISDFSNGELNKGQVRISSFDDFNLSVGDIKIKLKDSGITVYKGSLSTEILSLYGINKIIFNGKEKNLLPGYSAEISGNEIQISKSILPKKIDKIFPNDQFSKYNIEIKNNFLTDILSSFIVFKSKREKYFSFKEKGKFNECIQAIADLSEKEKEGFKNIARFYTSAKEKCLNKDILSNPEFKEKLLKNIEKISFLKGKYFFDEGIKKFEGKKISFIENIFYLQKNISMADVKNFDYFLENTKKSFKNENNLKNLEIGFYLIDGILKNNLQFSFQKIYDFRNKISAKILAKMKKNAEQSKDLSKYISKIQHFIGVNSDFIDLLLEEKKFKEIDYILVNKIIYENIGENKELAKILADYDKNFDNYQKLLDSAKGIFHGSADEKNMKDIEELKKAEAEKQKKEQELKKLLDSFKPIKFKEVKITKNDDKETIIEEFEKYGFKIDGKNIKEFMKGGSMFFVNSIEFNGKKYDVVYNINTKIVSKIKSADGNSKFDGHGSMTMLQFKELIAKNNYTASVFSDQPSNVFQGLENKEFSHEDFLKKELVRKYLESVGIFTDSEFISKIGDKKFAVQNAKTKKYDKINISLNIQLISWNVENVEILDEKGEIISGDLNKKLAEIKLAKNLKPQIEKIYGDYLLRNENLTQVLADLAGLGVKTEDVFLGKDKIDGFKIYKGLKMSSGDGILSGDYYVGKKIFTNARFSLLDHIEDFENVSVNNLIERIKFINKNIENLEQEKIEEEKKRQAELLRLEKIRQLNYGNNIPDELIDGAWITD